MQNSALKLHILNHNRKYVPVFENISLSTPRNGGLSPIPSSWFGIDEFVKFMGNVSGVSEKIKSAEIFAFSSDYEGMPNALAEAMVLGLACVSTDCSPGGARMLINNGKNGIIVPCNDADAFSVALRSLLSDTDLAKALGAQARRIKECLMVEKIASEWEEYFELVINKKNK